MEVDYLTLFLLVERRSRRLCKAEWEGASKFPGSPPARVPGSLLSIKEQFTMPNAPSVPNADSLTSVVKKPDISKMSN